MRLKPGTSIRAEGIVFDMDGTLIDSQKVIRALWRGWAMRHGLVADAFIEASPGRRIAETIRLLGPPHLDIVQEEEALVAAGSRETEGLVALPGAADFLKSLPPDRWAIATSAARSIAERWLDYTGLPRPKILVAAGDVPIGKPHPGSFLRAAELLGLKPSGLVVFEDALSGLIAGTAAGTKVIAIAGTLAEADLDTYDWLPDFKTLGFGKEGGRFALKVGHSD